MDFRRPAIRVRSPELLFARPRFARNLGLGDCRRRGSNCAMCFLVLEAASLARVQESTGDCGWFQAAGTRRQCSGRSEEHTSELQSRQYLVCRLLLEKKKNKN